MTRGTVRLEAWRFLGSQFTTALGTGAEWLCIWLLLQAPLHYAAAAIFGAITGGMVDFLLKKRWVFATARQQARREATRYALVSGASALWFGGVVSLCVEQFGATMPVAVVLANVVVGLFWNYPLHRFFVFSSTSLAPVSPDVQADTYPAVHPVVRSPMRSEARS